MKGRLAPLVVTVLLLTTALVVTLWRLDATQSDAYHWRNVAAARDTLVQDAQGRAHRAAVDLSSVREMYRTLAEVASETEQELQRLRARPHYVTTVTVQAEPETLYVQASTNAPSGDTFCGENIQSYAFWVRSYTFRVQPYIFDFAGATVTVWADMVENTVTVVEDYTKWRLSAAIQYKPVRLTVTTSQLRDLTWRTDVAVDPPIWGVADIQSFVYVHKPSALSKFCRRYGPWVALAGAFYLGLRAR